MGILGRIIDWARADFPGIPVFLFACEPGIKNKGQVNLITRLRKEYNLLLESYCAERSFCRIVRPGDHPFLYEKPENAGNYNLIREDLYTEDRTHFSAEGCRFFFDFIREVFSDLL